MIKITIYFDLDDCVFGLAGKDFLGGLKIKGNKKWIKKTSPQQFIYENERKVTNTMAWKHIPEFLKDLFYVWSAYKVLVTRPLDKNGT